MSLIPVARKANILTRTEAEPRSGIEEQCSFLLLMEDYCRSYTSAIEDDRDLLSLSYRACAEKIFFRGICYGDAYLHAMSARGVQAQQVVPLCRPLQDKWAAEHDVWLPPHWVEKRPFRSCWTRRMKAPPDQWALDRTLNVQIEEIRPRYLWVFSGVPVSIEQLRKWRAHVQVMILWWSCPIVAGFPYEQFDLILSCHPPLIDYFSAQGIKAARMAHAFDRRVLDRVPPVGQRTARVGFVGMLSRFHKDRIVFLDALSRHVPVYFYGSADPQLLSPDSPLRKHSHGPVWGDDLYRVYGSYLIVVHKDIDFARASASAKRLFEATGMGACVITEASADLSRLFESGKEIVTYSSTEECVERVKYLLAHPLEALAIGKRGQRRTLSDHGYGQRVQQLFEHLDAHRLP